MEYRGGSHALAIIMPDVWEGRYGRLVLDTMGLKNMRIYLAKSQAVPIDGGERRYRAPAYFNVSEELAEKWIGLGYAVEATLDNTHVEPEGGWSWEGQDRHGPKPKQLAPGGKKPKGGSAPRKAQPKPLEGPKAPKGEKPKAKPWASGLRSKTVEPGTSLLEVPGLRAPGDNS